MGGFNYADLAARLAEQAALAGGGLSTGDNELDATTTIDVTTGNLILAASQAATGVIALQPQAGLTIVGPAGSAMVVQLDGGDETLTWLPGSFQVETRNVADEEARFTLEPDNVNILAAGTDASVSLSAVGGGSPTLTIQCDTNTISMSATGIGFYGSGPAPKPTVPLTTPSVQDVIDALVQLGLVSQSD